MELPEDSLLLRVFLDESDRHGHRALYEVIVLRAREQQLAGATVLRSPMGFGASERMRVAKVFSLSAPLPVVVEFVDREEKIHAFLPVLEGLMDGGMATLEKVRVVHYRPKQLPAASTN